MSYEYSPGNGYGPLRFGMTPDDVKAILGEPVSFRWPFEGIPVDDYTEKVTKDQRFMDFPQTQTSNEFPQVGFDKGKVVLFTLFDKKDPVLVDGINLFDKDRDGVLRALAKVNDTYYENEEDFFFPQSGVVIPNKKASRSLPYIILVEPKHQLGLLDYSLYDPSTRLSK